MKTKVGCWIDHKKAIIVALTNQGAEIKLVVSMVEKHLQRAGDSPLKGHFEAQLVPSDDRRQKALTGHLNTYYGAVTAALRDAEAVLIFGPGEAKGELKKRMGKERLGGIIVGVETAERMTDRQIAEKVRRHFATKPKVPRARAGQISRRPTGPDR